MKIRAFATEILERRNKDLKDISFDHSQMRNHLKECFIAGMLTPFPKLSQEWKDLMRTDDDINSLAPQSQLTDKIMDAASSILKSQFPVRHTLKDVIHCIDLADSGLSLPEAGVEAIQFHLVNQMHYVLTTSIGGILRIFDSSKPLYSDSIDADLLRQIKQIYSSDLVANFGFVLTLVITPAGWTRLVDVWRRINQKLGCDPDRGLDIWMRNFGPGAVN